MMICHAQLDFPYHLPDLQKQVHLLLKNQHWLAHYNKVHYTGDWEVLPLRTPSGDLAQPFAESLDGADFKDTILINALPEVSRILNELKCKKTSVRLLNLKAGALIKPHRDFDLSFEKGEARLHFPIFTNPKVTFKLDDEILPMQAGECWYINANLIHEVSNKGEEDRIHLVVDCLVNTWLKQLFELSKKKVKTEPVNKEVQMQIIENLRMLNTAKSTYLANLMVKKMSHE